MTIIGWWDFMKTPSKFAAYYARGPHTPLLSLAPHFLFSTTLYLCVKWKAKKANWK